MPRFALAVIIALAGALHVGAADDVPTSSSWIWYPENPSTEGHDQTRYLRRSITLDATPVKATLRVRGDDAYTFRINGNEPPEHVGEGAAGAVYDLTDVLRPGENVLAFAVYNAGNVGGLIVRASIELPGGRTIPICTDTSFRASKEAPEGWDAPGFDDTGWQEASIVGSAFATPWFRHSSFDLRPFITDADWEKWNAWREPLLKLPEGLDDEPAARARFEYIDGSCALVINDEPRPALVYRGTVDPLTSHGRRQIGLFRDAGVHVYAAYMPLAQFWTAPGQFDFEALDDTVRAYLSADPEAHIMLHLRLVPPGWWMDQHPDEMVGYAAGDDFNTADESGRVMRPSFASKVWLRDALEIWTAAINHLEAQPWGKRIIAHHPGYGIYTEWHYFGSWHQQSPDTGPAMTAHFREWLTARYGTDEKLQEAWGRPEVTLATASVPGVEPRRTAGPLGFHEPVHGQWVVDYYRCQQEVTVEDIDLFCAAAKQATGGRVLCGAFYGYFYGVPPQTQGGHLELERLLASPNIDYFAAPYDYSHRLMGDDGRTRAIQDAFPIAGKVHMIEADTRTHLHPANEYGRLQDTGQSVAAIRREVATALLHRSALWWCDFGSNGNGGWYDHPELIGEVARMVKLAEARLKQPQTRRAEVAVVCDLRSCYRLGDDAAMRAHYTLLTGITDELYRTGVPFDTLLQSQLSEGDTSGYRLFIFPASIEVTPEVRRTIAEVTEGRSVLWLWAPGISDGTQFGADQIEELTGFQLADTSRGAVTDAVLCPAGSTLTEGIAPTKQWELTVRATTAIPEALDEANWYNPRNKETMQEQYTRFDWKAGDGGLVWNVATTSAWSDIHLNAPVAACDGISLTVSGEGACDGAGLRLVVKGVEGEFAAPQFTVKGETETHVLPFAAFEKAPWDRTSATQITFPLRGMKLVIDGIGGGKAGTLRVAELSAVDGDLGSHDIRSYPNPVGSLPVPVIVDETATPLGVAPSTGDVVVACRGPQGARQVISTVPFVPREPLTALMDDAGVCRYIDSPDVIVRADGSLICLHTAVGGEYMLSLPHAAEVRNAFTDEPIGSGKQMQVTLPPNSTTLLAISPTEN